MQNLFEWHIKIIRDQMTIRTIAYKEEKRKLKTIQRWKADALRKMMLTIPLKNFLLKRQAQ